jgi:hypothetical protein
MQVEGFPPKDQLKTVYVEHDIDHECAELWPVEFIYRDPTFTGMPKEEVRGGATEESASMMLTSLSVYVCVCDVQQNRKCESPSTRTNILMHTHAHTHTHRLRPSCAKWASLRSC